MLAFSRQVHTFSTSAARAADPATVVAFIKNIIKAKNYTVGGSWAIVVPGLEVGIGRMSSKPGIATRAMHVEVEKDDTLTFYNKLVRTPAGHYTRINDPDVKKAFLSQIPDDLPDLKELSVAAKASEAEKMLKVVKAHKKPGRP